MDLTSTAGKLIRRILGAVASMERDLLIERTQAGLARAKAEGKALGRPIKTTAQQQADMRAKAASGGATVSELARTFGVSRGTVRNVLGATDAAGLAGNFGTT